MLIIIKSNIFLQKEVPRLISSIFIYGVSGVGRMEKSESKNFENDLSHGVRIVFNIICTLRYLLKQ